MNLKRLTRRGPVRRQAVDNLKLHLRSDPLNKKTAASRKIDAAAIH